MFWHHIITLHIVRSSYCDNLSTVTQWFSNSGTVSVRDGTTGKYRERTSNCKLTYVKGLDFSMVARIVRRNPLL